MKIAITTDLYYPMTNGIAVFSHNLAVGLAKKGHEVMVLCPSFTGKPHKVKRDGVTTVYLRSMRMPFYPDQINKVPEKKEILGKPMPRLVYRHGIWISPDPYPEMKKALDKFKPDVVHNQTPEFVAIAAGRYVKKRGVPLVSTGHAYPDNITSQLKLPQTLKKPLDAVMRKYMAGFLKRAEYATMPTEVAIADLVPKNRRRFKVPVEPLSNGVDLSLFTPGKPAAKVLRRYKLEAGRPRVLYVGRIDPEKSISHVVTAFAGVVAEEPEAELVLVGDGTDRPHLEDLAKALGITEHVRFLGRVMPPEITEIYRASTVFVTASETETQGIVLIEAAATGLPIVAVDAGAAGEVCQNGRNGILCKPREADEIAGAVLEILRDAKLREKFSRESLEIAKKHDLNRTLERFLEIYQEAIKIKREKEKE